jgi:hypothetical protein
VTSSWKTDHTHTFCILKYTSDGKKITIFNLGTKIIGKSLVYASCA